MQPRTPPRSSMMASSRAALLAAVLLLLVSSLSARAEADQVARARAPALGIAAGSWVQQGSQEAAVAAAAPGTGTATGRPGMDMGNNGAARWRRTAGRRGRGGGGTGAWAFSAMLPRGFVPSSGSSACHNDMPATAADAQFFMCGGDGTP